MSLIILLIVLLINKSFELNNGLGLTPQMGWDSLYALECKANETSIQWTTDIIVVTGLAAVGYQYVILDDCWQVSRVDRNIIADSHTFPSGIRPLADYVHSKNLKFGLSSDAGSKTCNNRPGSLHYEKEDANTYASWTVDYLKYDNCFDDGTKPEIRFPPMRDALNATGRPIFFSIREWASDNPYYWEVNVANSWRTTEGSPLSWEKIIYNIDANNEYVSQAGPGGWNDPGILQVGNGYLTYSEEVSQFSLWSISKAPLIIGADLTKIAASSLDILRNEEVIAINQDSLGIQGKKVAFQVSQLVDSESDVIIENCSLPTSNSEAKRFQWIYNTEDGSIRSNANHLCLSIENCSTTPGANILVSQCQINQSQSQCQGKNQQWIYNQQDQTIVSQINGQCLDVADGYGPNIDLNLCNKSANQQWIWNSTDQTFENKNSFKCLTFKPQLEIWASPLSNGSQAVLLFNRNKNGTEPITVQWTDIGFNPNQSVLLRDLWTHQDIGTFTQNYTSNNIDFHSVVMLKLTPIK